MERACALEPHKVNAIFIKIASPCSRDLLQGSSSRRKCIPSLLFVDGLLEPLSAGNKAVSDMVRITVTDTITHV